MVEGSSAERPPRTSAGDGARRGEAGAVEIRVRGLTVRTETRTILQGIDLDVPRRRVLGLIGPSGAGKTTLLRCLNRLVDLTPELEVEGDVRFRGGSIYGNDVDVDRLRTRIGMLFQQPVVFPGSVRENTLFGLRHAGDLERSRWPERMRRSLRAAALWEEVEDRLDAPASTLSVGQRQRLCLARALALEPSVLLMDEPTSALDPGATRAIEDLVRRLSQRHTIVVVTHDMDQARRVSDRVACLCLHEGAGRIVETAEAGGSFDSIPCWRAQSEL